MYTVCVNHWTTYSILCPHTDGGLLKIKKREQWLLIIIREIIEWFMTLHEKLILVKLLEIQKENLG